MKARIVKTSEERSFGDIEDVYKDINSLEELIAMLREEETPLILTIPDAILEEDIQIEIYDDWRE